MSNFGNTKSVGIFIKSLNEYEFIYARQTINYIDQVREMIKKFNIKPKEFCLFIKIPLRRYKEYVGGTYPYSLNDIVRVECLNREYLKKEVDTVEFIKIRKNNTKKC